MIRRATEQDLNEIVRVHRLCFPKGFVSALGDTLLKRYYKLYMDTHPTLFLVYESDEAPSKELAGFCMGYDRENYDITYRFIKQNFIRFALRVAWLLLIGNRAAWKRVANVLVKKPKVVMLNDEFCTVPDELACELLSVCVVPELRGNGAASMLVDRYLEAIVEKGRKLCVLGVLNDNARAIRFYEKKEFTLFKQIGDFSKLYAKRLVD